MILTITLNSAVDKVLLVEEFTPGLPMQAIKEVNSVGGKGLDVSVALRHLGVETLGLAFMAGESGKQLAGMLELYGIMPELIWVEGETRVCYVIAETKSGRVSHIKTGELKINSQHIQQFLDAYQTHLPSSAWVVCSGSIPPSLPETFYGKLVKAARQAGVKTLVDCTRNALRSTLADHPNIVKMNWEEFLWTFDVYADTFDELVVQARRVAALSELENLVITCGRQGILAVTQAGTFHAHTLPQQVVNAAGAGDAASAAIVWRLTEGDTWQDALKWAAAAGAAAVLTEGTADLHKADALKIYRETIIELIHG